MSDLDEYLRNELRRTVRPVDINDVSSKIDLRRSRRARTQRAQRVALTLVVIAGTVGGVAVLANAFRTGGSGVGAATSAENGAIVYSEVRNAGQHLWVVNPDGTGARQLTNDPNGSDSDPSISPDGRTVAFVRTGEGGPSVSLIGIDGAGLRELSPLDVPAMAPSWSPDGARIAFAAIDGGIYVARADGNDVHRIANTASSVATGLTWSPDGTRIAFSAGDADSTPVNDDLWITDVRGVTQVNITVTPDANELSPAWSPDGDRILFSRGTSTGASLMTIAPDPDATPVTLTDGTTFDEHPSWSPDGARIVFDRTASAGTAVYTMKVDGSDLTLVARNAVDAAWQPIAAEIHPTPTVAPSSTPTGDPVNLGLGFPVCDVHSLQADFDGDGTLDTASTATKMSDVGGCPAPGTSTMVIVADLNGDGKADASGGPLSCTSGCAPFATPDVDDDGLPEIAIVVDQPGDGTKRIQLWDVTTPAGGTLAVIPFLDGNGDPVTFTWGTVENWSGNGPEVFGVSCTSRTSPPLVIGWQAVPTGPDSWHITEHGYDVVGTDLRSAFEDSYDVPGEETVFPDGGGDTMCGTPVQVSD